MRCQLDVIAHGLLIVISRLHMLYRVLDNPVATHYILYNLCMHDDSVKVERLCSRWRICCLFSVQFNQNVVAADRPIREMTETEQNCCIWLLSLPLGIWQLIF